MPAKRAFLLIVLTLVATAFSDDTSTPTPPPSRAEATQGRIAFSSDREASRTSI
jgi:hypothetical protein